MAPRVGELAAPTGSHLLFGGARVDKSTGDYSDPLHDDELPGSPLLSVVQLGGSATGWGYVEIWHINYDKRHGK